MREFGAYYGDDGHALQGAPGDVAAAITGEHGFVTLHFDSESPQVPLVEVYSFPVSAKVQEGTADLTAETEVTDLNCGQEIEAQTLRVSGAADMKTRNLILSVPECDAAGNFLVLNNLPADLKVAAK